jgi:hypothetical protein
VAKEGCAVIRKGGAVAREDGSFGLGREAAVSCGYGGGGDVVREREVSSQGMNSSLASCSCNSLWRGPIPTVLLCAVHLVLRESLRL